MLVAQEINQHNVPVYGCYIKGRQWFFMVLREKNYSLSEAYLATRDDIFEIFSRLKALKQMITALVEQHGLQ